VFVITGKHLVAYVNRNAAIPVDHVVWPVSAGVFRHGKITLWEKRCLSWRMEATAFVQLQNFSKYFSTKPVWIFSRLAENWQFYMVFIGHGHSDVWTLIHDTSITGSWVKNCYTCLVILYRKESKGILNCLVCIITCINVPSYVHHSKTRRFSPSVLIPVTVRVVSLYAYSPPICIWTLLL
jgi:hypothetical protein